MNEVARSTATVGDDLVAEGRRRVTRRCRRRVESRGLAREVNASRERYDETSTIQHRRAAIGDTCRRDERELEASGHVGDRATGSHLEAGVARAASRVPFRSVRKLSRRSPRARRHRRRARPSPPPLPRAASRSPRSPRHGSGHGPWKKRRTRRVRCSHVTTQRRSSVLVSLLLCSSRLLSRADEPRGDTAPGPTSDDGDDGAWLFHACRSLAIFGPGGRDVTCTRRSHR